MENSETHNNDQQEPTVSERGDLLRMIKQFALDGYLLASTGTKEDFEKFWRQAFDAD